MMELGWWLYIEGLMDILRFSFYVSAGIAGAHFIICTMILLCDKQVVNLVMQLDDYKSGFEWLKSHVSVFIGLFLAFFWLFGITVIIIAALSTSFFYALIVPAIIIGVTVYMYKHMREEFWPMNHLFNMYDESFEAVDAWKKTFLECSEHYTKQFHEYLVNLTTKTPTQKEDN